MMPAVLPSPRRTAAAETATAANESAAAKPASADTAPHAAQPDTAAACGSVPAVAVIQRTSQKTQSRTQQQPDRN